MDPIQIEAIITQNAERGMYYIVYPKQSGKRTRCTDQKRIAEFYKNQYNSQLPQEGRSGDLSQYTKKTGKKGKS